MILDYLLNLQISTNLEPCDRLIGEERGEGEWEQVKGRGGELGLDQWEGMEREREGCLLGGGVCLAEADTTQRLPLSPFFFLTHTSSVPSFN